MAYATAAQTLQLIDARLLGDLVADDGTRVTPSGLLTDANLALALSVAAGQINSSALIGQRYTVAELEALTGDDQALLTMLNAWLALGVLCSRRGRDAHDHPEYVRAVGLLAELRKGETLFNVPADVSKGVASTNFPSTQDYTDVNSLRTATPSYFPVRRSQTVTTLGS